MDSARLEQFRSDFFQLAADAKSIVITAHFSPDDDSIASVLTMHLVLTERFPEKKVRIVYTGEPVTRYAPFFNFEKIEFVDDVAHHLEDTDLLIVLDTNKYERVSKYPEKLSAVPKRVVVDHHANVPDEFTFSLVVSESSSNAELLYHAFLVNTAISKSAAELILLGIIGDTGGLSHVSATQSQVFSIVKELVEIVGVSIGEFRSRYGGMSKRTFEIIQELMKNTHYETCARWPDFQYTYIDRSFAKRGDYSDEEISAASHIYLGDYLPRIVGYSWGFVITPRADGTCRMSGRSRSVNVRILHEQLGIGSGHDRAAGGAFKKSEPKDCIQDVLEWMKQNEPAIL